MNEVETRICRYYNTTGGCWYGDKCKFLHISDEKPRCKFYISSSGCRFGDSCHFSHERPLDVWDGCDQLNVMKEDYKENVNPREYIGTNNNSMELMHANATLASTIDPNALSAVASSGSTDLTKSTELGSDINPTQASSSESADGLGNLPASNTTTLASVGGQSSAGPGSVSPILESDFRCGSCKRPVIAQGNESYYNLLKDHYLECFMGKEGDHVKYVKFKAALEPGQMYWCKTCILVFEKPWSLFQHMGDKATGTRLQRWEKKAHMDWLDTVAGLMAGHDLGLFTPGKIRADLRNLLADRRTVEEEMESAALTAAAAMMQFIEHISNPIIAQKAERYLHMGGMLNERRFGAGGGNPNALGGFSNFPGFFGAGFNKFNANRFLNNVPHGNGDRPFYGGGGHPGRNSRYQHNAPNAIQGSGNYHPAGVGNTGSNNTNSNPMAAPGGGTGGPYPPAQRGYRPPINQANSGKGTSMTHGANAGDLLDVKTKPEGGSGDVVSDAANGNTNWNCGFTEEEVRELLSHGVRPWDEEAAAALSALRGEMDHLLE